VPISRQNQKEVFDQQGCCALTFAFARLSCITIWHETMTRNVNAQRRSQEFVLGHSGGLKGRNPRPSDHRFETLRK